MELASLCTQSTTARSPSGQIEVRRYRFFGVRMYNTKMVILKAARIAMHIVVRRHLGQITNISEWAEKILGGKNLQNGCLVHTISYWYIHAKTSTCIASTAFSTAGSFSKRSPKTFCKFALLIELAVVSASFLLYWLTQSAPPSYGIFDVMEQRMQALD